MNAAKHSAKIIQLLILLSIALFLICCSISENRYIVQRIEASIKNDDLKEYSMDDYIDIEWDLLVSIGPYSQPEDVSRIVGLRNANISSNVGISDKYVLLIFIDNGEIVSYVDFPRSLIDFPSEMKIEKEKAIFALSEGKATWISK